MTGFVFVGERPSNRAAQIGATWQNGKLAGRTLRDALVALNISPDGQKYLNLYRSTKRGDRDGLDEVEAIRKIEELKGAGYVVVGMGRIVCHRLNFFGVEHLEMVHPAARGAIRKVEVYRAHVAHVLREAEA